MKSKFLYFFAIFSLTGFFIAPNFVFAVENNGYNVEKIFYLPKYNAEKGVESLNNNWEKIDILAPQYHVLNADFTVSGGFGPKLRQSIKDHNLKVMPLIANSGFSQKVIHNFLLNSSAQDKVLDYLVKGALTNGYIGWQFDFENINYQDRDLFTAFAKKAHPLFLKNNLVLSFVAVPRMTDYENTNAFINWAGVYDYGEIAKNCDFVSLMVYDDPKSVGPVASIDFVNKELAYVKDKIPPEKLSLGVPLYYWKWNADTNTKIGSGLFKNVPAIMAGFQYVLSFDKSLGVSCLSYSYNSKNYKIWFEDQQSFQEKLNIIKDNNLRGFSAWLLGGEDPAIWSLLSHSS